MSALRLEGEGLRFIRNLLLAFLPSAVLGLMLKDQIDIMLGSPMIVAWALIVGGIAIIGIEKIANPRGDAGVADLPLRQVIGIGLAQCLSMIPGVSRSGATIMGALAMGVNRRTAAEFSFFLAVPTMLGATTLELATRHTFFSQRRGRVAGNRHRVRGKLCRCPGGDPCLCRLCQPPRLCTLCLVSYRAGGCRAGVALGPVAGRLRR